MKKYLKHSLFLVAIGTFYCCSNDDSKEQDPQIQPVKEASISLKLVSEFTVSRYNTVSVDPEVLIENGDPALAKYKWTVKVTGTSGAVKDSVIADTKTLQFIAPKAASYAVDLTVTLGKMTKQASTKVAVSETGKTYTSKALLLIDYLLAPSYNSDNTPFTAKADVMEQIQSDLIEGNDIALGTFGGSIVTKFDHTVINTYGKRDFTVLMTQNSGSLKFSPVSIYVAYDANKNGIADENEWYEIAGSEHNKSTTVKNYEITYNKPNPAKAAVTGTKDWQFDKEYLKWTDNKNASGFITKTKKWRRYNYYPQWMGESYTVKGTKIYLPIKDVSDGEGTVYNVGTFEWGYGGIKDPSIDISWAVDNNGKKVHLPGIDFVKVFVSTFAEAGGTDLVTSHFVQAEDLNFSKSK
ncbi:hypothetical protein NJT12_02040 [Flavobacterium sp. AC]|uniref:Uncharacterized protein n=1 Tax=Flavobacterium azizsancarii TaxID=2961580 RepID=A0ABT4W773_9FLAO|nr:hypothetical protein [Flavobacterium azizsancarii]MDA6068391.1 hypothetical protein [Flavobacterium azizsancarii]